MEMPLMKRPMAKERHDIIDRMRKYLKTTEHERLATRHDQLTSSLTQSRSMTQSRSLTQSRTSYGTEVQSSSRSSEQHPTGKCATVMEYEPQSMCVGEYSENWKWSSKVEEEPAKEEIPLTEKEKEEQDELEWASTQHYMNCTNKFLIKSRTGDNLTVDKEAVKIQEPNPLAIMQRDALLSNGLFSKIFVKCMSKKTKAKNVERLNEEAKSNPEVERLYGPKIAELVEKSDVKFFTFAEPKVQKTLRGLAYELIRQFNHLIVDGIVRTPDEAAFESQKDKETHLSIAPKQLGGALPVPEGTVMLSWTEGVEQIRRLIPAHISMLSSTIANQLRMFEGVNVVHVLPIEFMINEDSLLLLDMLAFEMTESLTDLMREFGLNKNFWVGFDGQFNVDRIHLFHRLFNESQLDFAAIERETFRQLFTLCQNLKVNSVGSFLLFVREKLRRDGLNSDLSRGMIRINQHQPICTQEIVTMTATSEKRSFVFPQNRLAEQYIEERRVTYVRVARADRSFRPRDEAGRLTPKPLLSNEELLTGLKGAFGYENWINLDHLPLDLKYDRRICLRVMAMNHWQIEQYSEYFRDLVSIPLERIEECLEAIHPDLRLSKFYMMLTDYFAVIQPEQESNCYSSPSSLGTFKPARQYGTENYRPSFQLTDNEHNGKTRTVGRVLALMDHVINGGNIAELGDLSLIEGSHLCGHPTCIRRSHVHLESHEANEAREECFLGNIPTCTHTPPCILNGDVFL